jgi:hypothetical protein
LALFVFVASSLKCRRRLSRQLLQQSSGFRFPIDHTHKRISWRQSKSVDCFCVKNASEDGSASKGSIYIVKLFLRQKLMTPPAFGTLKQNVAVF